MKKHLTKLWIALLMIVISVMAFSACSGKECEHSYRESVTNPTCTERGYTTHTCDLCGNVYTDNYTDAHHSYGAWIDEIPADCKTEGTRGHYHCSACNKDFDTNKSELTSLVISATGHNYGTWIEEVAASCDKVGALGHYHCSACNKDFDAEKKALTSVEIELKDHTYGTWIEEVAASCDTAGTLGHYHCSACNKDFDNDKEELDDLVIPADHTYGELINEIPATCAQKGTVAHYNCSECGKNFDEDKEEITDLSIAIDEEAHAYGEWESMGNGTHAKYCANNTSHKVTEDCTGGSATCLNKAVCEVCICEYGEYADHIWDDDECSVCHRKNHSYGLNYTLSGNGYLVSGRGSCQDLDIIIPATYNDLPVIGIKARAFKNCYDIKSVTIPDSVLTIGEEAFYSCSDLQRVIFEGVSKLATIETNAFNHCKRLMSITIPESVTKIEYRAFNNLDRLVIYCEAASEPSGWEDDWHIYNYGSDGDPVIWDCKNNEVADDGYIYATIDGIRYALKNGKAMIGVQSYYITEAIIPSTVTYNNTTYTVDSIYEWAFSNCPYLKSIKIPSTIRYIYEYAFANNAGLLIYCEVSSKPSGWNSKWADSYSIVTWNCNNKDVANDGAIYTIIDDIIYAIKDGEATVAIQRGLQHATVVIPSSITYKNVEYPVTALGNSSFATNDSLVNITIPNSVKSIEGNAFGFCEMLYKVTFEEGSQLVTLGESVFQHCTSLVSITIPDGVTTIESYLFYGCDRLETVIFGKDSQLETIGYDAFYECESFKSIVIPVGVTTVYENAFETYNDIEAVYYAGDEEAWAEIEFYDDNEYLKNAPRYYYSEEEPTEVGDFWHYVNGIPTVWTMA